MEWEIITIYEINFCVIFVFVYTVDISVVRLWIRLPNWWMGSK